MKKFYYALENNDNGVIFKCGTGYPTQEEATTKAVKKRFIMCKEGLEDFNFFHKIEILINEVNEKTIKRNYNFSSYGTGGAGYYEHRGVTVSIGDDVIEGYFKYSSQGYGTFKEVKNGDYYGLNERYNRKYDKYVDDVQKHFNDLFNRIESNLQHESIKTLKDVKRLLKNGGHL